MGDSDVVVEIDMKIVKVVERKNNALIVSMVLIETWFVTWFFLRNGLLLGCASHCCALYILLSEGLGNILCHLIYNRIFLSFFYFPFLFLFFDSKDGENI